MGTLHVPQPQHNMKNKGSYLRQYGHHCGKVIDSYAQDLYTAKRDIGFGVFAVGNNHSQVHSNNSIVDALGH